MADSQTPVGDWLRNRYPPNDGATHYLGEGDDPGCCAGPHPACTYSAGFREGLAWAAGQADGLKFRLWRPSKDGPGGGTQALDVIPASELLGLLRQGGKGGGR